MPTILRIFSNHLDICCRIPDCSWRVRCQLPLSRWRCTRVQGQTQGHNSYWYLFNTFTVHFFHIKRHRGFKINFKSDVKPIFLQRENQSGWKFRCSVQQAVKWLGITMENQSNHPTNSNLKLQVIFIRKWRSAICVKINHWKEWFCKLEIFRLKETHYPCSSRKPERTWLANTLWRSPTSKEVRSALVSSILVSKFHKKIFW